jgi:excisionase family DNA binding protein
LAVLTYAEAAERIRGTERFIRRLVERGELDYMRVGRSNVVFEASLERWVEANRVRATTQ